MNMEQPSHSALRSWEVAEPPGRLFPFSATGWSPALSVGAVGVSQPPAPRVPTLRCFST